MFSSMEMLHKHSLHCITECTKFSLYALRIMKTVWYLHKTSPLYYEVLNTSMMSMSPPLNIFTDKT